MPRFSEQFIQQVAQATDIVDLIAQYVALKQKGREFVGLCPFHNDKNPSMYVVPAKQIYHCFVCQSGGGVFQWMMQYEKLSFPEAVEQLADRANIPLPAEAAPAGPADVAPSTLVKLTAMAADFFHQQLMGPGGQAAREYAIARGLTQESLDRFSIGYAPNDWEQLTRAARRQGFTDRQLLAAGLVIARGDDGGYDPQRGCYDRFRHRLMFPIHDRQGRPIAFGGRALDPADRAKYINSPEGPLFDKSGQLYGLWWAREGIGSSGQAVVVEGYMDCVIPLQAGLSNVVATLGTALTDRHVTLLSRHAREVVLVFDSDAAGAAAADRALEMFLHQQLHVRVATVPSGKDPCDYTLAFGGEAMKKVVADAPDALQYAWGRRESALRAAGDNLAARQRIIDDFLRLVVSSAAYGAIDEIRRGQLAQHIAHILNISAGDLQTQMRRMARHIPRHSGTAAPPPAAAAAPMPTAQRHVVQVLLNRGDLFDLAAEKIDWHDFSDPRLSSLAQAIWRHGQGGELTLEAVLADETMAAYGGLIAELAAAGEREANYEQTLADAVAQMLEKRCGEDLRRLKDSLHDDDVLRQLQQRLGKGGGPRRHPGTI
jgi:DNA primase